MARLPGVETPVELFSVQTIAAGHRAAAGWQKYSQALNNFEAGDFQTASEILATLDQTDREIPVRFLAEHVQRELGSLQNRRSTDRSRKPVTGVITLSAK
jgi:hypothetical protein